MLGTVPKIAQPPRRAKPEDAAEVIESFRGIRLRLQYAYSTNQPLVCGVTSPEQGDGKSLVASNLALAFAEAGYRTLLIDADTRRGALHEVFAAQRSPGLIEVLSGEVPRAEVLHATSQERLMLLPCGGRRTTNPELIASSGAATAAERAGAGVLGDHRGRSAAVRGHRRVRDRRGVREHAS